MTQKTGQHVLLDASKTAPNNVCFTVVRLGGSRFVDVNLHNFSASVSAARDAEALRKYIPGYIKGERPDA
jgi:hypothetical protein